MSARSQVFVLTTGRSGSVTFTAACGYIVNFSSAHESRAGKIGDARFAYPDQHIEIDNRLSWHLGGLAKRFPDASYVHLRRDPVAVARSYRRRWQEPRSPLGILRHQFRLMRPWRSLPAVYGNGIVQRYTRWPDAEKLAVSEFMVETINDNIAEFVRDKDHMVVDAENVIVDFARFWEWCGAEGDLDAALSVWNSRLNETSSLRRHNW